MQNPLISASTIPVDRNMKVLVPNIPYYNLFDEDKKEFTFYSFQEYEDKYRIPPFNDLDRKPLIYRLNQPILKDQWRAFTVHERSTGRVFAIGERRVYCFPQLVRVGEGAVIPVDGRENQDASRWGDVFLICFSLINDYAADYRENIIKGIQI